MTGDISKTLQILEKKFGGGVQLDGQALKAKALPSDMFIAGYTEERTPDKKAAVLIPLIPSEKGPAILFTKRPEAMKEHPGQISFPGGRMEKGENNPETTALREAEEEVGLNPGQVKILGRLAPYHTITRYEVIPVIGLVSGIFNPVPDPREVEAVFTAPLAYFLAAENLKHRERIYQGRPRPYYYFDYLDYHIWGATAAMLINFREALFAFTRDG